MGNDDRSLKQRIQSYRAIKDSPEPAAHLPAQSRPTTFTLYRESELLEKEAGQASGFEEEVDSVTGELDSTVMTDSTFGVQSLSEALDQAFPDANALAADSPKSSPHLSALSDLSSMSPSPNPATSRKRKAGNPVHPKILATGQRIISSESLSARPQTPSAQLKMPAAAPTFQDRLRTMSSTSAQTPYSGMSLTPNLEPAAGLTPGSGSPRSVRLSDDDAISFDDNASQAILSSSGEEDNEVTQMDERPIVSSPPGPQLVMPSVTMPAKRRFTERGKQLGRLRILIAGQTDTDRVDLVNNILESCEHIVHTDDPRTLSTKPSLVEYKSSTKPQMPWMTEGDGIASKLSESSDAALDYNVSILLMASDNSGENTDDLTLPSVVSRYIEDRFSQLLCFQNLDELDTTSILTDGGGLHPDLVYYMLHNAPTQDEARDLAHLSDLANVSLVVSTPKSAKDHEAVERLLDQVEAQCIGPPSYAASAIQRCNRPVAVSSQSSDSSLTTLMTSLFHPVTIHKLRYSSAQKFLSWRKTHSHSSMASPMLPNLSNLPSDLNLSALAPPTHTCSTISSPSGVLVPYPDSSFYQSTSPALSGHTIDSTSRPNSALALATLGEPMHQPDNDIKEVRLAQWALDLQKALEEDRRRQTTGWLGLNEPIDCIGGADGKRDSSQGAIVRCNSQESRPYRSRERKIRRTTKGHLTCTDAYDPLGIIRMRQSLKRNGVPVLLRAAGIIGALGTIALWVSRNWEQVTAWLGWPSTRVEEKQTMEYAMGWQDAQSWRRGYEAWGLRDLVDRAVEEVGRLRPVGW
ncbi:hypothetical protein BDZ85DRAFT_89728 [Elsinoe ampelina]|uniref:Septin-type G domain-containing protein n=1 Tax=Elsinoe ampelina TaxID=302913 RepID=A0A6A6GHJ3_9PEZI|nr:hypothetical protein BDZ85DRAFT_89728 [Elsinoe ampelina]